MSLKNSIFNSSVIVAALGYFVDIYDLVLFSVVRTSSLKDLGLSPEQIFSDGIMLLNAQMFGMIVGGIFWGIWGDKKGRLQVLFGSILLYSVANLANAFVTGTTSYEILRFIAGIGLAGELGAGITLVLESVDQKKRGLATALVAGIGVAGAVFAALLSQWTNWRIAFAVGGVLGLALLFLRVKVYESSMYEHLRQKTNMWGQVSLLFKSRNHILRYLGCIFFGVPIWFVIAILITFSPEIIKDLGFEERVSPATGILFSYTGLVLGDFLSGLLSQKLQSRKRAGFVFLFLTALVCALYRITPQLPAHHFEFFCFLLGLFCGYWALFVTIAGEQFGANIRAFSAISVPNFVRGFVVILTLLMQALRSPLGLSNAVTLIGAIVFVFAFASLYIIDETFHKDLNYVE